MNSHVAKLLLACLEPCPRGQGSHLEAILASPSLGDALSCPLCLAIQPTVSALLFSMERLLSKEARRLLHRASARRKLVSVLSGLLRFGLHRQLVPGAPFQVIYVITQRCNLNCSHCHSADPALAAEEMDTGQAIRAIDALADAGTVALSFSGGEPLLREDLLAVVNHAVARGLFVSITTNGTLLTRQHAWDLREAGVATVAVSLDGACPATHDERRGQGSFLAALRGIAHLKEAGLPYTLSTVVTEDNVREVPDIIALCHHLSTSMLMIYNYIPVCKSGCSIGGNLSPREQERLLAFLAEELRRLPQTGLEICTTNPRYRLASWRGCSSAASVHPVSHQGRLPQRLSFMAPSIGGCGAGRFLCALLPNGDVAPCGFLHIPAGNITRDAFTRIWNDSPLFKELRERTNIHGPCGSCPHQWICGGCRSMAYSVSGDYLASDPTCFLRQDPP